MIMTNRQKFTILRLAWCGLPQNASVETILARYHGMMSELCRRRPRTNDS